MHEIDECISRYRRLLQLMEEDIEEIAKGIQGEIRDSYRDLVKKEKDILQNALRSMQIMN